MKPPFSKTYLGKQGFTASSGCIITATGIKEGFRGANRASRGGEKRRPSLAIVDDPQTDESANSDTQCHTRLRIIKGAVKMLGSADKPMSVVVPCTVIRRGDLADRLLDPEENPEFNGRRYKMLETLPTDLSWWENEYAEARAESLNQGHGIEHATALYEENRDKADGAKATWPERFNKATEVDAIQSAMNIYLEDRLTFDAECQNEPKDEMLTNPDIVDKVTILTKTRRIDRGKVPTGMSTVVGFIDVQSQLLYYMIMAFDNNHIGHIVDYGAWPRQINERYFALSNAKPTLSKVYGATSAEGRIIAGLTDLVDGEQGLFRRKYRTSDGLELRLERLGIDAGWKKQIIFRFASQSIFSNQILPSFGIFIGAGQKPLTEKTRSRYPAGSFWFVDPDAEFNRLRLIMDANEAKTRVHNGLAQEGEDPGSLRLYGLEKGRECKPVYHRLLAEHLTSEHPTRTFGNGRELIEWSHAPHKPDNHFFDCAAGCVTMASVCGVRTPNETRQLPGRYSKFRGRK